MDMTAVFGGKAREVEKLDLCTRCRENLARDLGEPEALRHLAGTRMLRARRAIDQQDASLTSGVIVLPLRRLHRFARRDPIDRKLIVGIGEFRAALRVCGALRECL